ncbi:Piso0_000858 [Millerozyma farinosa CBS 7064]|uniref:Piso0_000858 protein n=1 Tax=Pichia sorbitophila (strain ATCC MYA-4447 / BCRC 22081 / CBS 7064 / NBRC 10061 / NRRL Y-12695) TaxID=559304 RepID=G8YRQ3_PICSO|nr:Piso0_000858 [Millerozyma farinosa CBS 7064]
MFSTVFKRYFGGTIMANQQIKTKVQELIKSKPVFVASKQTYCPYCSQTKRTISEITEKAYILELDDIEDGSEIQDALYELTNQRTVPNVFIGGEHIGGNSDVQALKSAGKLDAKIKAVL